MGAKKGQGPSRDPPLTLMGSGRGMGTGQAGHPEVHDCRKTSPISAGDGGSCGGSFGCEFRGGWGRTGEEGDSAAAGDHGANRLAEADGVRGQGDHIQPQVVQLPPSAFKDGKLRGLNLGGCVCPLVSSHPKVTPHPLSVPPKPVSSRRVHVASVSVTTTCLKRMEGGKLTWKMRWASAAS